LTLIITKNIFNFNLNSNSLKQRLRFLLWIPGLGWRKAGENISKGGPKDNFSKIQRVSLYTKLI
jgi:hypothetical protein